MSHTLFSQSERLSTLNFFALLQEFSPAIFEKERKMAASLNYPENMINVVQLT